VELQFWLDVVLLHGLAFLTGGMKLQMEYFAEGEGVGGSFVRVLGCGGVLVQSRQEHTWGQLSLYLTGSETGKTVRVSTIVSSLLKQHMTYRLMSLLVFHRRTDHRLSGAVVWVARAW
jgi:hypothetical protein